MRLIVRASLLVTLLAVARVAGAATFTVNNTGNDPDAAINGQCRTAAGVCTLRAAIQEANATTATDTIAFAIATGVQTISLASALPTITNPVVIDGSTQPGYAGTPLIEISGALSVNDGLTLTGGTSTLRGLVINAFLGAGVFMWGKGGNVVEGCFIGTDPTGTEIRRTFGPGIRIESYSNRIGGTNPAQRNVISGNGGLGIEGGILITGPNAVANIVKGNYIGLDVTGMVPMGNLGRGVAIHYASYNLVGGPEPGAGNLIAGNRASGVRIMPGSTSNVVMKNWIGVNKQGQMLRGEYGEPGILSNARGVQVRGDGNYVVENVIAGNTEEGVLFYDGTGRDIPPAGFPRTNVVQGNYILQNGFSGIGVFVGDMNQFTGNFIWGNGHLGINLELRTFGFVTPNDDGDSDEGTNGFQNYPVLTAATPSGSQTSVSGTLASAPNRTYTIEFFANLNCSVFGYGEGMVPIGQSQVTTDAAGTASFTSLLSYSLPPGLVVTATATGPDKSTSEFSACRTVE